MHQRPSRTSAVATVAAVALVAGGAGALLTWGPDPERVRQSAADRSTAGTATSPVSPATSEAPALPSSEPTVASTSGSTAPPETRQRSQRMIAKIRAARAAVSDRAILRQLRNTAERIAAQERTAAPAPKPVDIAPDSNRALGYQLMLDFGFAADQWPALDALWMRESGWNHLAENPSSGAYGIPQSLPADKMAVVGDDWRTNPRTQIQWGLAYIAARYGVPDRAWAHSERVGWY